MASSIFCSWSTKIGEGYKLVDLYLDLISTLSEEELSILYHHRFLDNDFEELINKMNEARDQVDKIEKLKQQETIVINKGKY